VLPGAVTDELVEGLVLSSRISRRGQSCSAGSRLFLHRDVPDEVLARLSERLGSMEVGNPLDEGSDIGAVVNETPIGSIRQGVPGGRAGYPARRAGQVAAEQRAAGRGVVPRAHAVLRGDNSFRLAREEIFGPVVVAIAWDDVVRMANDTAYRMGAYVWSRDIDAVITTAHRPEAGWVQVNQGGDWWPASPTAATSRAASAGRSPSMACSPAPPHTKQVNVRLGHGATPVARTGPCARMATRRRRLTPRDRW
jgi:aldehyde dehydrogenase (NAD+)